MTIVFPQENVKAIISELRAAGIRLGLTGEQLEVFFPGGNIDDVMVEKLRQHKAGIIAFMQKEAGLTGDHISPAAAAPAYALSSSQKRLWILDQFGQGGVAYSMPAVYTFEGDLDVAALHSAFKTVIARHEILRTVFREDEDGEVKQCILPAEHFDFAIRYTDLQGQDHITELLGPALAAEALTAFDLAAGPLIRAALYQVAADRWIFSYVMHHIISDGWSMGVLIRELFACYHAASQQQPPTLPPLRIQYKDYAQWQQQEKAVNATHREYWQHVFSDGGQVLMLTGDQPRPRLRPITAAPCYGRLLQIQPPHSGLFVSNSKPPFYGLAGSSKCTVIPLYRSTGSQHRYAHRWT